MRTWPLITRLNALVRTVVLLALTGTMITLAFVGSDRAIEAVAMTFVSATSFYFGERAGLAQPHAREDD
jgi:hypothetical protein